MLDSSMTSVLILPWILHSLPFSLFFSPCGGGTDVVWEGVISSTTTCPQMSTQLHSEAGPLLNPALRNYGVILRQSPISIGFYFKAPVKPSFSTVIHI